MARESVPTVDAIEVFAHKYIETLSQRESYRASHPDAEEGTIDAAASRFMRRPDVRKRVQALMDARAEKLEISAEKVLQEIAALAFANHADFLTIQDDGSAVIDLTALTRQHLAAIQEITVDEYVEGKGEAARNVKRVKLKLHDKGVNLERLGKHLKLFTEVVEHKGLDALAERMRKAREQSNADLAG